MLQVQAALAAALLHGASGSGGVTRRSRHLHCHLLHPVPGRRPKSGGRNPRHTLAQGHRRLPKSGRRFWREGREAHACGGCLCGGCAQAGQASAAHLQQEHRLQTERRWVRCICPNCTTECCVRSHFFGVPGGKSGVIQLPLESPQIGTKRVAALFCMRTCRDSQSL